MSLASWSVVMLKGERFRDDAARQRPCRAESGGVSTRVPWQAEFAIPTATATVRKSGPTSSFAWPARVQEEVRATTLVLIPFGLCRPVDMVATRSHAKVIVCRKRVHRPLRQRDQYPRAGVSSPFFVPSRKVFAHTRLVGVSRVRAGCKRSDCRDRPGALHQPFRQSRTGTADPDRLPAQQSDEHVGLGVLSARATRGDGVNAAGVESSERRAGAVDVADRAGAPQAPQDGPVGGILVRLATALEHIDQGTAAAVTSPFASAPLFQRNAAPCGRQQSRARRP